jgi:hypothetical protein
MLLDALFHYREGSAGPPLKNVIKGVTILDPKLIHKFFRKDES